MSRRVRGIGIAVFGGVGAGLGLLTANIVSAALLSDEDAPTPGENGAHRPPRLSFAPLIDLSHERAQLGIVGRF